MTRTSGPLPFLLLAATAVLVLVFSFQTRLMDLDRHSAAAQDLLHLKQLDTQLDEQTLKAVSLQLMHYDSIVGTVARMKELNEKLHNPTTGLYGLISPALNKQLNIFKSYMQTKFDLVESVKSRTAIVRNTINYLPLEIARITAHRHDPQTVDMHRLLSALLFHNITQSENSRLEILDIIDDLKNANLTATDRVAIDKVLVHVAANLSANDDIAKSMTRLTQLPTTETLDDIYETHMTFTVERIRNANTFRVVLLVLTLILFAGLAFALMRLRKAHDLSERTSRQFRDAAQSIGEGFAFFDAEGRLSFWNATFEKLHADIGDALTRGVTFVDFQQTCLERNIYEDLVFDEDAGNDAMRQALGHPYIIKFGDGSWILASDSPMADGGTASVRIDITATKHAEEQLRKLSRAVEQSPASVMITDTQGIITYVNPKFEDATGYSANEAIGQRPQLISSGEKNTEEYEQLWKTITSGGEWRGEFHNKRKDGTLFWEYASISPIKNERGEITSYVAVKEDITDRKKVISELMTAKEQAEMASHAKTQFLANMSHELRTPLNAIIGFSEMIKEQMFGPIGNDNYVEYSSNILTSGQHLLGVINDILDVSRIETGTMVIRDEHIDIVELCHTCLDMVKPQAEFAKLALHGTVQDDLPKLHGDAVRMKQVILNLLSNAIKFTPQGGKIDFIAHREEDGALALIVRDSGYGIPENKRQSILEPFEQVSDIYTRNHEGSGMGLFLVNSFVTLHGGSLEIDSEIDTGTTVTVRFPIERTIAA
ncbi:DAHL domain-containing protein [Magnetovibrio sp.]|uniref:DAHL domain-containing protein n=1 Tax=Magnetovibrio sp. TaxID=2024836 RepID=UPI002F923F2C